jgi:nucleoside-diphosphate-sugar epimerase
VTAVSPGLTVAVTGPTGTFGSGLIPRLQADERIAEIVGIARRPFQPSERGWSKMTYRQGDIRDPSALKTAFGHADVVVHLAFWITGTASRRETRRVNVEGTVNAFRAAVNAGVKRFVYASSVAAYGFHRDNPIGLTEDWPVRPAVRLFYAQEKAELELRLNQEAHLHPGVELYILRPPIVLGPHAMGAKSILPGPLTGLARLTAAAAGLFPLGIPVFVPALPLQVVHEDDVGDALMMCVVAAGPPGAYNVAADGILTSRDLARHFSLMPLPFPTVLAQRTAQLLTFGPTPAFLPAAAEWIEAASHPVIVDTVKAKSQLSWRPKYSARETLRATPSLLFL